MIVKFKKQIMKALDDSSLSFTDLIHKTNVPTDEAEEILAALQDEGQILFDGKEYVSLTGLDVSLATIVTRKPSFAFVKIAGVDHDLRMSGKLLDGLIVGDRIYVRCDSNYSSARFAGFYKRPEHLIGTLTKKPRKGYYLKSPAIDDAGVRTVFVNDPEDFGATDGDMVKVKIKDYDAEHLDVEMIELLVKSTDVGADISKIIAAEDAPLHFTSTVLEEAKAISQEVAEKDKSGREDFRDRLIVTIDGADALDFDDAVEVERIDNGYRIGVHIADVSHYVRENSPIDQEAYERGTSIYVADRVVPMLPTELSNGICSLNPDVERLTMSVVMDVDMRGNVYRSQLYRGLIKSKGRLTYQEVNDFFADKTSELEPEVEQMLTTLLEATHKIRKRRENNGAMKLDSTELKFVLDQYGHPLEVVKRVQGEGEKMIEDLMIIANVAVAKTFAEKNLPTLYRIHENPPTAKIEILKDFLTRSKLSKDFPAVISPKALSYWLSQIADPGQHKVASHMMLRSLAKARYSLENAGHFGLCEEDYLHFTSPIRRYPDLIVHRLVKKYLLDDHAPASSLNSYLEQAGDHLSAAERRAQSIERAVDDLEATKYMSKHLGDEFIGCVSSLMPFGMFMELDNGIEALLPHDLIDNDTYIYDPVNFRTAGLESRRWFNIGSNVPVRAYSVDMERRQINVATEEYYYAELEREKAEGTTPSERQTSFGRRPSSGKPARGAQSERRSYAKRDERKDYGERRSDARRGDSRSSSYGSGNRRPYDGKRSSERRPYSTDGEKSRRYDGEKRSYNSDRGERSDFKKYSGERRPYNSDHQRDGKRFGEKREERKDYGERRSYSSDRKREGKYSGEKRESRSYGSDRRSYSSDSKREHRSFSGDKRPHSNYGRSDFKKPSSRDGSKSGTGEHRYVNKQRSYNGKKGQR